MIDIDFARPALEVAPLLLGHELVAIEPDGARISGRIVETEAYASVGDPASHSHRGPTPRTTTMFGPPGGLYVYRIYGMHWCANIACAPDGVGEAVLIRALEPLDGVDRMGERRAAARRPRDLCSGPGKLCAALAITGEDDGVDVRAPDSRVHLTAADVAIAADAAPAESAAPMQGPRIGITKAMDLPWRFGLASDSLSRPFPLS